MTNFKKGELGAPQIVDQSTFQAELDALRYIHSRDQLIIRDGKTWRRVLERVK